MKEPVKYPNAVRVFHYLQGSYYGGRPLVNVVHDEGYDEFIRIAFGLLDHRTPPKFKIRVRWEGNSNLANWDVIRHSGGDLLSGKVRRILEVYDRSSTFYPVRIDNRWGEPVDAEFYCILVHNTPGGEVDMTALRQQSASPRSRYLSNSQVGDEKVFRTIFGSQHCLVSHEVFEHLVREKCKGLDNEEWLGTRDIEWDPDADVGPYIRQQFPTKTLLERFITLNRNWVEKYQPGLLARVEAK